MEWINNTTCCHVAIVLSIVVGVIVALFLGYTVKISRQQVKLKKNEQNHQLRLKELEKKNGKELKKIEELEKISQEDRKIIDNLQITKRSPRIKKEKLTDYNQNFYPPLRKAITQTFLVHYTP